MCARFPASVGGRSGPAGRTAAGSADRTADGSSPAAPAPRACLPLDQFGLDVSAVGAGAGAGGGADGVRAGRVGVGERLGGEGEGGAGLAGVAEPHGGGVAGQVGEVVRGELGLDLLASACASWGESWK